MKGKCIFLGVSEDCLRFEDIGEVVSHLKLLYCESLFVVPLPIVGIPTNFTKRKLCNEPPYEFFPQITIMTINNEPLINE